MALQSDKTKNLDISEQEADEFFALQIVTEIPLMDYGLPKKTKTFFEKEIKYFDQKIGFKKSFGNTKNGYI